MSARLTTDGSLWTGNYTVTADENSPSVNPVNAIFTGALWMGGVDQTGDLFVRANGYSTGQGNTSYLAGPLIDGETTPENCTRWDRFFSVNIEDVRTMRAAYQDALTDGTLPLSIDQIPASLRSWPGMGNPLFEEANGFPLHTAPDGLAPFWDENLDAIYDPTNGDYPLFCGDEAIWVVFNTGSASLAANPGEAPFQIEVMAYATNTDDADLQRTTFYDYKVKYYGEENLNDFYFGHFVDSDLGCSGNDRADSSPENSLFYVYNDQASEGDCPTGEASYGESSPVNVFQVLGTRVPLINGEDNSGIQQYNTLYNVSVGAPNPGTTDPLSAQEVYNTLKGFWRDGSPIRRGGDGYTSSGAVTKFAFDGGDINGTSWRSCNAEVPAGDIRSVYSKGPYTLAPGANTTFTLAVTTLFNVDYADGNCPNREAILNRAAAIKTIYEEGCPREFSTALTPEPASAIQLDVFPNPVQNKLNFHLPAGERTVRIDLFGPTGKKIVSTNSNEQRFTIDVMEYNLVPGPYFYRLYTASNRLVTGKVIVTP